MNRIQASALLGVRPDADAEQVRGAWRVWARVSHPDAGGDAAHFRDLVKARDVMLEGSIPVPTPMPAPKPRASLRDVLHHPGRNRLARAIVFALLALVSSGTAIVAPIWLAALIMGLVGALAATVLQRAVLSPGADVGHTIAILTIAWAPIALAQVLISVAVGASVLSALPILALPFAAAVGLVNPGAGLWHPIPR